jgi:ABC-type spermidine/putrescine transport system permease subunit II
MPTTSGARILLFFARWGTCSTLYRKIFSLVGTLSMDEIAVTFFLIGRQNTLPLEIWSRLGRGATPEMNAIAALIFLFSAITTFLSQWLISRKEGEMIKA